MSAVVVVDYVVRVDANSDADESCKDENTSAFVTSSKKARACDSSFAEVVLAAQPLSCVPSPHLHSTVTLAFHIRADTSRLHVSELPLSF